MKTIDAALNTMSHLLKDHSDSPRIDAELLVAHGLHQSRSYLYAYPEAVLAENDIKNLKDLLERRRLGEPVAYIIGVQEFWSIELEVTPDTLIPRPETEHLVEWILENFDNSQRCVADLGTGSGAIALALASERPDWIIHATDSSIAALNVAQNNAQRLGLDNIKFHVGNWCDALPKQHYDIIASNPPYISENDKHLNNLLFEPRQALSSGAQGLDAIKTIATQAPNYLNPKSALVLEHGYNQAASIKQLLTSLHYQNVQSHRDLAALNRFITCYI